MKRKWPEFHTLYHAQGNSIAGFFINWLEVNIPKDVLDRIAPPICENHEPVNSCAIVVKCVHCGAEIRPSGWELK